MKVAVQSEQLDRMQKEVFLGEPACNDHWTDWNGVIGVSDDPGKTTLRVGTHCIHAKPKK